MNLHNVGPTSTLVITAAVLQLCSCLTHQGSTILRSLATNKATYQEHETAAITASFVFPPNKSMLDYKFLWTVGHPDMEIPFIEDTKFTYRHRNSEDIDKRIEISFTSHSSGTGSIRIKIHDLRLADYQKFKLSVFLRDQTVEILHDYAEIRVDHQGATTQSRQMMSTISLETESDASTPTLTPTTKPTPLRNYMWIPLGLIFLLFLFRITLKVYHHVIQSSHTCSCTQEETPSTESSSIYTSTKESFKQEHTTLEYKVCV
ncbi:uncharacterized protein LOC129257879 [Lytechinus pictus]|uniref:uncharacterized protein LOC129257879 n=1 Tax=Lytechinus pictus TaxID=7653 RepID=UPI00240DE6A0|nr:uncharacterized protein LOC129257879 [Lytechinus pictus]